MKTLRYTPILFLLVFCPGFLFGQATATTISAGASAPATISSLSNAAPGTTVFNFDVNDDASGNDAFPTLLSTIFITANTTFNTVGNNWSTLIAGATLEDGTNTFASTSISTNYIEFAGMPTTPGSLGYVADGATKHYSLKIYLKTNLGGFAGLIDGLQFHFEVFQFNIALAASSSFIIAGQSANSGNANAVTVVATTLRFLHPVVPMTVALNTDFYFPAVMVEATDANGNRDFQFSGANSIVRSLSNVSGATMANGPIVGTTAFTAGLLTFANNFKFLSGSNGDDVTLTIRAGQSASTSCGTDFTTQALCATSTPVTLLASFESSIVADPTYTFAATLDYINHQEASNIQNTSTSQEIARVLLVDGDRNGIIYGPFPLFTPYANQDGVLNGDIDGAATNLTSLTLRVTNPSNIRRIALYDGTTEISGTEYAVADAAGTPFRDFVFTGTPLLTAADNSQAPLSVRVSYRNTAPEVTDHDPIHVSVVATTLSTGSQFYNSPPDIAGVPGGFSSSAIAPNASKINVLATKLDFVTQPAPIAGINQPVIAGVVEARDQFYNRDLDFSASAGLIAAVPINGSFAFVNGVLDISAMQYLNTGDGTITVSAAGLSSNSNNTVNGLPNVSVSCSHVDVLHVTASYNPNGVVTSTNLVGGTANKVIFGFTFNSSTVIPGSPKVERFTISFSNLVSGVFQNMKVFESTNVPGSFGSATDITVLGGTLAVGPSSLTVVFVSPRDLSTNLYSYFLMADIDPSASGATPQIGVSLVDGGFGSGTNNNILTAPGAAPASFDKPSSSANVQGQTYTFAPIFAPILVSSYPALAQSNVDPNQSILELWFSAPVFSLDQQVRLNEKLPGGGTGASTLLTLLGPNGDYLGGSPAAVAAQPIIFNIPPGFLLPDREYFVTIAQGIWNGSGGTGFMDQANNLFPGIYNPGTLYFRTVNYVPPKLLGLTSFAVPPPPNDPNISDLSATGATLNAIFDKPGKAYYLVLTSGSTPPTAGEIKNPGTYPTPASIAATGSFDVNSVNPVSQFGTINPIGGTFTPGLKDVWIYAESFSENNHILTPIPNVAPYGNTGSNFQAGSPGPTLQFTAPAIASGPLTVNLPNIFICNGSYQIMNSPIIISEGLNTQLYPGGPVTQTLGVALPPGFVFDVTLNGSSVPVYGSITLLGSDFVPGSGTLSFIGNNIVRIQFVNNGTASRDKIIISGLRVKSTTTASGSIFRFGGNGLLGFIPENTPMGTLSSYDAPSIDFDNSYSTNGFGISQPGPVITAIPDDAVPSMMLLTPYIDPATNDFGPSTFSGPGVIENILNISAVTHDVPFNITITHTDNNGCVSHNPIEYLVYDHNTAVNISQAGFLNQGPYCSTNSNFVPDQVTPAIPGLVVRDIHFDNVPGYRMETLTASIPASADPSTSIINPVSFGGAWNFLIQSLPNLVMTFNIGGRDYRSYTFDEAKILNSNSFSYSQPGPFPPAGDITAGTLPDPYSFFRQVTPQGQTYYSGGSLGFVELNGVFRSVVNPFLVVPRKQLVEFFLPAIPIVEVGQSNQPVPGTRVYCESGGPVVINGYPAGSAGQFMITDDATGMPLAPAGFVDNGNGTATLDPSQLKNNYQTIRITYYFHQNNSPCSSSASIDIQVAPNPVSVITAPPTGNCIGTPINFSGAPSSIAGPGNTIISYQWTYGAVSATTTTTTAPGIALAPSGATSFQATLVTSSNRGCQSLPATMSLTIGGIQTTSFSFTNGTTTSPFTFVNTSSTYSNDSFANVAWNFGDGSPTALYFSNFSFPASHFYTVPGTYTVTLTVTSTLGCTGTTSHQVTLEPPAPSSDPPPPPPPTPPVITAIPGARISEISLGENYPNPFIGSTSIPLALPGTHEEFHVAFELYDTQGKLIQSMPSRTLTSGLHNIEINPTQSGSPLRAGLYLFNAKVQGRSEGGVFVRKIIAE